MRHRVGKVQRKTAHESGQQSVAPATCQQEPGVEQVEGQESAGRVDAHPGDHERARGDGQQDRHGGRLGIRKQGCKAAKRRHHRAEQPRSADPHEWRHE